MSILPAVKLHDAVFYQRKLSKPGRLVAGKELLANGNLTSKKQGRLSYTTTLHGS